MILVKTAIFAWFSLSIVFAIFWLVFRIMMVLGFFEWFSEFGKNCNFRVVLTFDCFGYFLAWDGWFMDFIIMVDSKAIPWCIVF